MQQINYPEAYIRLFQTQGVTSVQNLNNLPNKYYFSNYRPVELQEATIELARTLRYPDDYVLCPLYSIGDIQLGMTGTAVDRETHRDAIYRELGEEFGILPTVESTSLLYKNQRFNVYATNLLTAERVPEEKDNIPLYEQKTHDNKSVKVGCLVYASAHRMIEFLSGNIYRYYSEDNIVGLVAIRFDKFKQRMLLERENRYNNYRR